jgi:hypothetical protein
LIGVLLGGPVVRRRPLAVENIHVVIRVIDVDKVFEIPQVAFIATCEVTAIV